MPEFNTMDLSIKGGVAEVTFNRPEQMNTFSAAMADDFYRLLDFTDADDEVRAIIVTGSGRAFCAGADLGNKGATFDYEKRGEKLEGHRDRGGQVTLRIFESLKPIICAVNGAAVGIGATMQLAMDVRLASSAAKFGFVFARRGITPEACSSWFLPRIVGISTALEWSYTGRVFGAAEALDRGLVRSLYEPDELLPAARALAAEIASNSAPVSVAMIRQMMWRLAATDHPMEAHKIDSRAIAQRGKSEDAREGIAAFLEKRPAVFPNRVSSDMPDVFPWWPERTFS
jgi:enoyl-CoA hydratase/carnithine racemase